MTQPQQPTLLSNDAAPPEEPWTQDRAIAVFLNRWAHNWRGERKVIEYELRELIAEAKRHDPRAHV